MYCDDQRISNQGNAKDDKICSQFKLLQALELKANISAAPIGRVTYMESHIDVLV